MAAIVGLCMCPWNLLKSSNSFTSYLSAYSVFLSSIAGVMVRAEAVQSQHKDSHRSRVSDHGLLRHP